ncbi:MAG: hypothetical protein J0L81_13540 [Caulobacterales bacterium]|jgi:hypothetical protein|nr:hypothetical protein [Caulobacterales bacterium]
MSEAVIDPAGPTLPLDRRPLAFAGVELVMDLLYVAKTHFEGDYEALLLHLYALRATETRGGVSRRELCEWTGLARETVRRKVALLLARGDLVEQGRGRLKALIDENTPHARALEREAQRATQRYVERVARVGVRIEAAASATNSAQT